MPRASGRRLTYRERWEQLQGYITLMAVFERNLGARDLAAEILKHMDKIDHMTLVKARPVRKWKGRKR